MFESIFNFLFSYPKQYFDEAELIPQTWGNPSIIVVLALIGLVLVAMSTWRNRDELPPLKLGAIACMQLIAFSLAIAMLIQPVLEIEELRPQDNKIVVLVDTSRSMALSDDGEISRLQAVLPTLDLDVLQPLEEAGYQLELQSFSGSVNEVEELLSAQAEERSSITSQLTGSLQSSSNQALAGLILVSDGADNSNEVNELWYSELRSFGVPVQTLGVGREVMTEDIEVSAVNLPNSAIPQANLRAEVTLQSGSAQQTTLKVYDGERIIAAQDINLPGNGLKIQESISIPTGDVGVRHLRFVVDNHSDEFNTERITNFATTLRSRKANHECYTLRANHAGNISLFVVRLKKPDLYIYMV